MTRPDLDAIERHITDGGEVMWSELEKLVAYARHLETQREQVNVNTRNLHERITELAMSRPDLDAIEEKAHNYGVVNYTTLDEVIAYARELERQKAEILERVGNLDPGQAEDVLHQIAITERTHKLNAWRKIDGLEKRIAELEAALEPIFNGHAPDLQHIARVLRKAEPS